jgi:hypothetical protein
MLQAAYMAGSVILTAAVHISSELESAEVAPILPLAVCLPMLYVCLCAHRTCLRWHGSALTAVLYIGRVMLGIGVGFAIQVSHLQAQDLPDSSNGMCMCCACNVRHQ